MKLNAKEFYQKSVTFDELLSDQFLTITANTEQLNAAKLKLSSWCETTFRGDWTLFTKRINRDNLDVDFIIKRFANSRIVGDTKLPEWLDDINWIYEKLIQKVKNSDDEWIIKKHINTIPFIQIYLNLINSSYTKLLKRLKIHNKIYISNNARLDLKSNLLKTISDICDECLFHYFKKNLQLNNITLDQSSDSTIYISKYIDDLRTNRLWEIIDKKPILFRLIVISVRNWLDANMEMINRIYEDKEILQLTYGSHNNKLKYIESLKGGISDLHNNGRSVHIIEFNNFSKVVYKPKNCGLDLAFSDLINELNSNNPKITLRTAKIIAKDGYGWSEFISTSECKTNEEVKTFFEKSGAYLALYHLLSATDMHHENIIAVGSDPIPIDLEMLLQPDDSAFISTELEKAAQEANAKITSSSILNVGLIPTYVKSSEGKLVSVGGLNFSEDTQNIYGWASPNNDSITRIKTTIRNTLHQNLPKLKNKNCLLENYLDDFINGFNYYSEFLIRKNKKQISKRINEIFQNQTTRKVMRPTRFYFAMLHRLKDFRKMNDSISWSFQSDFISRFFDWEKENEAIWPIAKSERTELATLNIPTFYSKVNKSEVTNNNSLKIEFSNAMSGLEKSILKLKNYNLKEVALQISIIKSSLNIENIIVNQHLESITYIQGIKITDKSLIEEVILIAKKIMKLAQVKDKSASWIGINWLDGTNKSQFSTLGPDLYNGNSGIAIFLAATSKITNNTEILKFTYKTLSGLRYDILNKNSARFARSLGIGGAVGISSIIYSLIVISEILKDDNLIEDAKHAAKLITEEMIDNDKEYDVISGCAGAILALLKLYEKTNDKWILQKAIAIGNNIIIKNKLNCDYKKNNSINLKISIINGMAHGAAGISYAFAKLAAYSNDENFLKSSVYLINIENSKFDLFNSNWPSPVSNNIPLYKSRKICQWCHGAIGVGISRIALLKLGIKEFEIFYNDIYKAIQGCQLNTNYRSLDTLCCGVMGAIEFYQLAGEYLNNQSYIDKADQYLWESITHLHNTSKDYFFGSGSSIYHIGLFKGLSGIGYTILRRVNKELPNILIWE